MGKVFITGGNGFVAINIIKQLVERNHTVVATARSQQKADETIAIINNKNLRFVIVEDITKPESFYKVFEEESFDGVIHPATPFHYNITEPAELIDPAVKGTVAIMEAIKAKAPGIRRFVLTSSCASIFSDGDRPGYVYSEKDWNPIDERRAYGGNHVDAYYGAKTLAERAAWNFVEKQKPNFSLAVICPPFIFGPVIQKTDKLASLNTSSAMLYAFVSGELKDIPTQSVWIWADVRNVAQAHVEAYEREEAANERFVVTSGNYCNQDISQIYLRRYPERSAKIPTRLPQGYSSNGYPEGGVYTMDNSKSKRILGMQYYTLEESIVGFMDSIKELEQKEGKI